MGTCVLAEISRFFAVGMDRHFISSMQQVIEGVHIEECMKSLSAATN